MIFGWQVLIRSVVKQRKLERNVDYSRLSERDGKKLIQGFKGVVLEGRRGVFIGLTTLISSKKWGQIFILKHLREKLPDTRLVVRTQLIELPR